MGLAGSSLRSDAFPFDVTTAPKDVQPTDASPDTLMPPRAVEVLEGLGKMQHPNLKQSMGNSVDVSRCGVDLRYVWGGPANDAAFPITEFYAWLVDQGGMVKKNRQSLK